MKTSANIGIFDLDTMLDSKECDTCESAHVSSDGKALVDPLGGIKAERVEASFPQKPAYLFLKRAIDIVASACGLVVLSPFIVGTAIAVKVTSPGPVVFKQKRVGINKTHFQMYKFRTMRIDTPSDMASHLINANDWMTPIGATLRKTSLDELPQLWNILKGDMTIIGPRPALWNQFDLIAERDKYGANSIKPGITGWAQINGRDELSIETKAMRDGVYVQRQGFAFDAMCFCKTIGKVLKCAGVIENRQDDSTDEERAQ